MATYTSRVVLTERYEVSVPTYGLYAPVAEIGKAISAIDQRCKQWGIATNSDDYCKVIPGDDAIIFYVEREVLSGW